MPDISTRTHPGEVLREEYMKPLSLSANALARALHVPPNQITFIIARERPRSVTALRLARFFRTTPAFWLNLQSAYDLSVAQAAVGRAIERDIQPMLA